MDAVREQLHEKHVEQLSSKKFMKNSWVFAMVRPGAKSPFVPQAQMPEHEQWTSKRRRCRFL